MVAPYRPTMVPNVPPRASMQPAIAKLDSLPRTQSSAGRSDYDLGYIHGRQAAYRNVAYIATALAAVGVVAWVW